MKVNKALIEEITHDVVYGEFNGQRRRMCDAIANSVGMWLEEYHGVQTTGDRDAYVQGRKHYAIFLPAEQYAGCQTNDGWVLIDPAIKQFQEQLGYEFPEVAVLPPNDSRRNEWYSRLNIPDQDYTLHTVR